MANEKRMIELETLIDNIDWDNDLQKWALRGDPEEIPTVDAVEVRCAECKHYQQYHKGRTEELCEWGKCKLISMDIDMPCNGFCCFGERRTNETEKPF